MSAATVVGTTGTAATVEWPDGRVVVLTADGELYEVERVGAPR